MKFCLISLLKLNAIKNTIKKIGIMTITYREGNNLINLTKHTHKITLQKRHCVRSVPMTKEYYIATHHN